MRKSCSSLHFGRKGTPHYSKFSKEKEKYQLLTRSSLDNYKPLIFDCKILRSGENGMEKKLRITIMVGTNVL